MLNISDILETITMIQEENLDIRTVTMGISLLDCGDTDIDASCAKIYEKICRKAGKLAETAEAISAKYGIPIINKRVAVTPVAMLAGISGLGSQNSPIRRGCAVKEGMPGYESARRAVTHYKVLERFGRYTLIEAKLETGRTHQIRVHMAYLRHPLLGDELYGPAKNRAGAKRQMLHAGVLGFVHPVTEEYMEFESPLPEDFRKVLKKIGEA